MDKLKIILAEDHNLVRNGIKMLLESQADIEVIAEADDGTRVLEHMASGLIPDIILADINMPEMDGISLIKAVKSSHPDIKVVILSMLDHEKYVMQAFMEGSYGYILKNVNESEMLFALKTVAGGAKYLCVELTETMLNRCIHEASAQSEQEEVQVDLSMREIEVLNLVAEGYTNQEMADKLFLSKRTIEGHRQMLIDKTGSKNTASLIRFAVVNGYLN
ncbi:response regulator transcription factor [uncultured Pedobacter sp.]|uniref:response regulator transcription factor n=1 Tax=uncultured Pedobacter sp. TaxID=246139 RepID=UPI0025EE614C|nr:response regulator transcription factor [uncultured Pedobacter sp.]